MKKLLLFSAVVILFFIVAPVLAAPTIDNFSIELDPANAFVTGDGSGYIDEYGVPDVSGNITPWYYYPNTGWYNQWFYDDPPDPTRWKEITYDIKITGIGDVAVVINWSTLAFPPSGPDGPPPIPDPDLTLDEELAWISREYVVYQGYIEALAGPRGFTGTIIIPDYNPEWVSIDVMGMGLVGTPGWEFTNGIPGWEVTLNLFVPFDGIVEGVITHECIPAPGAILLGSIGVGCISWLRRRRAI